MNDKGRCTRVLDQTTGQRCGRWEGHDGACWGLPVLWQIAEEVLAAESKTEAR